MKGIQLKPFTINDRLFDVPSEVKRALHQIPKVILNGDKKRQENLEIDIITYLSQLNIIDLKRLEKFCLTAYENIDSTSKNKRVLEKRYQYLIILKNIHFHIHNMLCPNAQKRFHEYEKSEKEIIDELNEVGQQEITLKKSYEKQKNYSNGKKGAKFGSQKSKFNDGIKTFSKVLIIILFLLIIPSFLGSPLPRVQEENPYVTSINFYQGSGLYRDLDGQETVDATYTALSSLILMKEDGIINTNQVINSLMKLYVPSRGGFRSTQGVEPDVVSTVKSLLIFEMLRVDINNYVDLRLIDNFLNNSLPFGLDFDHLLIEGRLEAKFYAILGKSLIKSEWNYGLPKIDLEDCITESQYFTLNESEKNAATLIYYEGFNQSKYSIDELITYDYENPLERVYYALGIIDLLIANKSHAETVFKMMFNQEEIVELAKEHLNLTKGKYDSTEISEMYYSLRILFILKQIEELELDYPTFAILANYDYYGDLNSIFYLFNIRELLKIYPDQIHEVFEPKLEGSDIQIISGFSYVNNTIVDYTINPTVEIENPINQIPVSIMIIALVCILIASLITASALSMRIFVILFSFIFLMQGFESIILEIYNQKIEQKVIYDDRYVTQDGDLKPIRSSPYWEDYTPITYISDKRPSGILGLDDLFSNSDDDTLSGKLILNQPMNLD